MDLTLVCVCSLSHGVTWIFMTIYGHCDVNWVTWPICSILIGWKNFLLRSDWLPTDVALFTTLEACLVLTSVKYHGNLYILIPVNQGLALTRLRATGPWGTHKQLDCSAFNLHVPSFVKTHALKWQDRASCNVLRFYMIWIELEMNFHISLKTSTFNCLIKLIQFSLYLPWSIFGLQTRQKAATFVANTIKFFLGEFTCK